MDEPTVFVDARNVIRSRWPNIPEDRFLELTREWVDHEGVRAVVVFDGPAPGGRAISNLDERTTVVGTGSSSADNWIANEAERLAGEGRRLWLVSSDRGLRARVRESIERTIGGGSFAGQLVALDVG
jgi:hypothetical protein